MRKSQKYVLIVLVLFVGASVVAAGKYYNIWNAGKVVSATQMKEYVETYLREYEYEYSMWNKILPTDQNHFSLLKDKPFLIKATISNSHGVAIEFIPSDKRNFQCQVVSKRIEQEIFPDKDFNVNYTGRPDSVFNLPIGVSYEGQGAVLRFSGEPGPIFTPNKNCYMERLTVITNQKWFLETSETSYLRMNNMRVDDVNYPNTLIINGSNDRGDWSRKAAKENALSDLDMDFRNVYSYSEDYRRFQAMPELTHIANEIIAKNKNGEYEGQLGYLLYKKDIAKLLEAADAHGIKHEIAMDVYGFMKEKRGWWERHRIVSYLTFLFLGPFLLWLVKWICRKLNFSQIFSAWWRKKFQHSQK
ncbi:MAG: hypothetical protein ABSH16_08465 [Sedimentisphaerales bacterium]